MILNREMELAYLYQCYEKAGSQLVVVYGQKNIGKKMLLKEFTSNKPNYYFKACASTERQQQYLWANELRMDGKEIQEYPSYHEIFSMMNNINSQKFIYIIDDFSYLTKTNQSFMNDIIKLLHNDESKKEVLVILCSSSVGFVENNMVSIIGKAAFEISGFLKIKELGYFDILSYYTNYSKQECLQVYSILGGVPGLWNYFDDSISVKKNICLKILQAGSALQDEGSRIIKDELRELSVYSTILSTIAGGKHKLNDLYIHTSFSRAKISVYLKNLMELEIIEKVNSFETPARENTQKGLYRIANHVVNFYFCYIYPHVSKLNQIGVEEFYERFISKQLNQYVSNYFEKICMQYMEKKNNEGALPIKFIKNGEWVGKVGTIPIIAENEMGEFIIGICNYESKTMPYDDYEWLLFCASKAKMEATYFYLFTVNGFDKMILQEANSNTNLKIVLLDDF